MIKKIHQIWIGNKPIPKIYKEYMQGLEYLNPNYEYKLWTERDFEPYLKDDSELKEWLSVADAKTTKSYVFTTDFLRCWILNKFGGWYFDTDMKFIKPLDALNVHAEHIFSKYNTDPFKHYAIFNCCMYCEPNSIFLKEVMSLIKKDDFCVREFSSAYDKCKDSIDSIVLNETYLIGQREDRATEKTVGFHFADHTWKE